MKKPEYESDPDLPLKEQMDSMVDFARDMYLYRKETDGMTQHDIANKVGVAYQQINGVLRKKRGVSFERLMQIFRAMDVKVTMRWYDPNSDDKGLEIQF